jgi:hypothetical protein
VTNDAPRVEDRAIAEIVRRFRRGREVLACHRHVPAVREFLTQLATGTEPDEAAFLELDEHLRCFECQLIRGAMLGEKGPTEEDQERTIAAILASLERAHPTGFRIAPRAPAVDRPADTATSEDPARSAPVTGGSSRGGTVPSSARPRSVSVARFGVWWRAAAAVAGLALGGALLVNIGFPFLGGSRSGDRPHHPTPSSSGRDTETASSPSSLPTVVVMTLSPGLTRNAGEQPELVVPAGVTTVRLELSLERDDYPSYDVLLETPEQRQVWAELGARSASSAGGSKTVTITVPANLLPSGDYLIRLTGGMGGTRQVVEVYTLRVGRP